MARKEKPETPFHLEMEQLHKYIQEQKFETIEELQAFLDSAVGKKIEDILPKKKKGRKTNGEKAFDLLEKAWNSSPKVGAKFARQAIELEPDLVDAYLFLASIEEDMETVETLGRQAVAAGKRLIGDEFDEMIGHFWGYAPTRPYMRAMHFLGDFLYATGREEEGIQTYQEMLRLNPGDNQGIRYELLIMLVEQDRKEDWPSLLAAYEGDPQAIWRYTRALALFKESGGTAHNTQALREAYHANPYFLEFLSGNLPFPDDEEDPPSSYALGSMEEGIYCLFRAGAVWINTMGTAGWLDRFFQMELRKKRQ